MDGGSGEQSTYMLEMWRTYMHQYAKTLPDQMKVIAFVPPLLCNSRISRYILEDWIFLSLNVK